VGVIPAFLYGPVWAGQDWKEIKVPKNVGEQIGRWRRLIDAAKSVPVKISIGQNMCSYATEEYLQQMAPALAEAGVDEFAFSDSFHGMGPDAWRHLCRITKEIAPELLVSVHIHNDWGLATASAVACALGGADIIEVTVNGMGGPGGQADFAETAAALEILAGIGTGVDMTQMTSLSKLVADITRRQMPSWKPITGDHAWDLSGIDEMLFAYEVDPLFPVPVNPEIFGNKLHIKGELGCASGNWSMYYKLQELGIEVEKSRVAEILKAVKAQMRLRKRALSNDEIRALAQN
jgi:2-isopropylmalate synthase/D-citramalate synthase